LTFSSSFNLRGFQSSLACSAVSFRLRRFSPGSVAKTCRACAGAPGLRSRSYFGGVGSAGRPAAFPAFAGTASCLRAEALRRASAQQAALWAVLTYSFGRSARPSGCGFPFEKPQDRTGRAPSARLRACFLNTPGNISSSFGHSQPDDMT
jgi:hypothetical protein